MIKIIKDKKKRDELYFKLTVYAALTGIMLMAVLPYVILIVGFIKINTIINWIQYMLANQFWVLIIVPLVYCFIFVILLGYIAFFVMSPAPSHALRAAVIKNIVLIITFIILVLAIYCGKV